MIRDKILIIMLYGCYKPSQKLVADFENSDIVLISFLKMSFKF